MWPQLTAEYRAVTYSIYSCVRSALTTLLSLHSTLYRVPRASLGARARGPRKMFRGIINK